MDRIKKCAEIYLSCNTKMEFFSIRDYDGIRIKITDLKTRQYITLWNDEIYKLIHQIIAYETVNEGHPTTWKEFLCRTFCIEPLLYSAQYILLTKYHKRIILDRQSIATLMNMKHEFNDFINRITPK